MIFLLNYERVRLECLELTRLNIAQALHIPPQAVTVEAQKEGEKVAYAWGIANEALPKGLKEKPELAHQIATGVARMVNKDYLLPRLKDASIPAREARK